MMAFNNGTNGIEAVCGQYNCSTAPTANDLFVSYTLQYVRWYYTCGTGHDLTATWRISVPYSLLLQDPNGDDYSFGRIRIRNGGTTLVTSSLLGQNNLLIVNNGTDPNCSSNTLYTVTYTWHDVSDSYFPDNYIQCSLTIYNNCSVTGNINAVGYTDGCPGPSSMGDVFTHPCDRVDQAFVNPNNGPNNCATIAGAYVVCTPPSGFTGTDEHQVEYRPVTNTSSDLWENQENDPYNQNYSEVQLGKIPGTGDPGTSSRTLNSYTDVLYLREMTPNSGKWIVRYRNIYNSGCSNIYTAPPPPQTWGGNWHQEIWNL
ncbi:MAG: hypothetical protein IPH18_13940 [Chitinophagaceae bacterium]|nr:hypothetical protein [Chitinophagaceae bacterium]